MAIVKATYTKSHQAAKASIRYIQHRKGKDGERVTRNLFGSDGLMGRYQANRMIDAAAKGSYFYRFAISPDPQHEDAAKDLHLRSITETTMVNLEERVQQPIAWVAAVHDDHVPHRHVHVVAVVPHRLQVPDFHILRAAATTAAREQRHQRDVLLQQGREQKEAQWEE